MSSVSPVSVAGAAIEKGCCPSLVYVATCRLLLLLFAAVPISKWRFRVASVGSGPLAVPLSGAASHFVFDCSLLSRLAALPFLHAAPWRLEAPCLTV